MKYKVITKNGMNVLSFHEVKTVSVWINKECHHPPTPYNIHCLVQEARKNNKMTFNPNNGTIDSFKDTPLFDKGQKTVIELQTEKGTTIWKQV